MRYYLTPVKMAVIKKSTALAGVAQWIECKPVKQGVTCSIPSQAHAWVAGQVPSRGRTRGSHTLMFLSLSFSFPSLRKIHK